MATTMKDDFTRMCSKSSSYSNVVFQHLFFSKKNQLKMAFSALLICVAFILSTNTAAAQSQLSKRNDFLTEKKQMVKRVSVEEKLVLSAMEIEFIDTNVKELKIEIEQVKKDAKKAKLFKEEEKYLALDAKLTELRQMAKDFKMIKTKTLTAI